MSQRLGAWVFTDINKFKEETLFDCCKARLSDMEYRDTAALTLLKEHDTAHYTGAQIARGTEDKRASCSRIAKGVKRMWGKRPRWGKGRKEGWICSESDGVILLIVHVHCRSFKWTLGICSSHCHCHTVHCMS